MRRAFANEEDPGIFTSTFELNNDPFSQPHNLPLLNDVRQSQLISQQENQEIYQVYESKELNEKEEIDIDKIFDVNKFEESLQKKYKEETREDKLKRYKIKKQKRKFKKKINYPCRQTVANERIRIKGRFISHGKSKNNLSQIQRKRGQSMQTIQTSTKKLSEQIIIVNEVS